MKGEDVVAESELEGILMSLRTKWLRPMLSSDFTWRVISMLVLVQFVYPVMLLINLVCLSPVIDSYMN
jgi:hypothetical protein